MSLSKFASTILFGGIFVVTGCSGDSSSESSTRVPETKLDEKDAVLLKQFSATVAKVSRDKGSVNPISLFLHIKNNSNFAIGGGVLNGTARTPDRTIPWGKGDIGFVIAGGIDVGEEKEVRAIFPDMGFDSLKELNDETFEKLTFDLSFKRVFDGNDKTIHQK